MDPPRDEAELFARARAMAGLSLGEIVEILDGGLSGLRGKGMLGVAMERWLGARGGSSLIHDFPALGVELKTIPVSERGSPRESTFVCSFSLAEAERADWASSRARQKLSRVLWVPIVTPRGSAMTARRVGEPVLWRPTAEQEAALRADFDDIMGLVGAGRVEDLDARTGRFLQARPKAAHGRARTRAYGPEGEPMRALPRGLYLRARFTGAILVDPAAMPR